MAGPGPGAGGPPPAPPAPAAVPDWRRWFPAAAIAVAILTLGFLAWVFFYGSSTPSGATVVAGTGQAPSAATATAATTPVPPVAPPQTRQGCPDGSIQAGGSTKVLAGCNIVGDIVINNVKMKPDDDPKTGIITTCSTDCVVSAPYGAGITGRPVSALESELRASGCTGGCKTIVKTVWPPSTGGQTSSLPSLPSRNGGSGTANCNFSIPVGAKVNVPTGCVITGDISVATSQSGHYKPLFDSDAATGLAVRTTAPTWVWAIYGASVTDASLDDAAEAVRQTGCGLPNGCARGVNKINWP